jgi:hypothetical protein
MEKRTIFGPTGHSRIDLITELAEFINLRIVPCPLQMPDVYLRSIVPLTVIVLGYICRKGAHADEVRR